MRPRSFGFVKKPSTQSQFDCNVKCEQVHRWLDHHLTARNPPPSFSSPPDHFHHHQQQQQHHHHRGLHQHPPQTKINQQSGKGTLASSTQCFMAHRRPCGAGRRTPNTSGRLQQHKGPCPHFCCYQQILDINGFLTNAAQAPISAQLYQLTGRDPNQPGYT